MPPADLKAASSPGFGPGFYPFLRELAKNNNRDWFNANKDRYLNDVQRSALDFVRSVGPKLGSIRRHLIADPRPVGGSVMRIYRYVRFAKDKSPYKTAVGIRFLHEAARKEEGATPGFYLRLAPGDSWVYAGIWRLEGPRLEAVRKAIEHRPVDWKRVRASVPEIEGESLKRPPPGFDPAHPYIDDLKRKGFSPGITVEENEVRAIDFPARFLEICAELDPLNRFLARAHGLDY